MLIQALRIAEIVIMLFGYSMVNLHPEISDSILSTYGGRSQVDYLILVSDLCRCHGCNHHSLYFLCELSPQVKSPQVTKKCPAVSWNFR